MTDFRELVGVRNVLLEEVDDAVRWQRAIGGAFREVYER